MPADYSVEIAKVVLNTAMHFRQASNSMISGISVSTNLFLFILRGAVSRVWYSGRALEHVRYLLHAHEYGKEPLDERLLRPSVLVVNYGNQVYCGWFINVKRLQCRGAAGQGFYFCSHPSCSSTDLTTCDLSNVRQFASPTRGRSHMQTFCM